MRVCVCVSEGAGPRREGRAVRHIRPACLYRICSLVTSYNAPLTELYVEGAAGTEERQSLGLRNSRARGGAYSFQLSDSQGRSSEEHNIWARARKRQREG